MKKYAIALLILNFIFLVTNVFFLIAGVAPTVNFVAGLVCLCGMMASWKMYDEYE